MSVYFAIHIWNPLRLNGIQYEVPMGSSFIRSFCVRTGIFASAIEPLKTSGWEPLVFVCEDNTIAIRVVRTGKDPSSGGRKSWNLSDMRSRAVRICWNWLASASESLLRHADFVDAFSARNDAGVVAARNTDSLVPGGINARVRWRNL